MINLEIGLEIRHGGVMRVCVIEDKTAVVVVTSYHSVSRNPARFMALICARIVKTTGSHNASDDVGAKFQK